MNQRIFRERTLRIPTPEQIFLEHPLAGLGRRGLAAAIDSLIVGFILVVLVFLVSLLIGGLATAISVDTTASAFLIVFLILLGALTLFSPLIYFYLFEYYANGQTPGKRLANIRVIRANGLSLDRSSAALRNLFRLIDMIPSYYLVGVWTVVLTQKQQRVGDLVANTVVIALPPKGSREAVQAGTAGLAGTTAPNAYASAREHAVHWLAHQYLLRRHNLEPAFRQEIANRAARAMEIPAQDLVSAEREIWARITSP